MHLALLIRTLPASLDTAPLLPDYLLAEKLYRSLYRRARRVPLNRTIRVFRSLRVATTVIVTAPNVRSRDTKTGTYAVLYYITIHFHIHDPLHPYSWRTMVDICIGQPVLEDLNLLS